MFLYRALVLGKAIMHEALVCFLFCKGGGGGRAAGKIGQVLEFFSSESGSAQLWD